MFWWLFRFLFHSGKDMSREINQNSLQPPFVADNRIRLRREDLEGLDTDEKFHAIADEVYNRHTKHDYIHSFSEPLRNLMFVLDMDGQVNNGGWDQYLFNAPGEHFEEAYRALRAIGMKEYAAIMDRIRALFPGKRVPKDTGQRRRLLDKIYTDSADPDLMVEQWNQWDDHYYDLQDRFRKKVVEYAERHWLE